MSERDGSRWSATQRLHACWLLSGVWGKTAAASTRGQCQPSQAGSYMCKRFVWLRQLAVSQKRSHSATTCQSKTRSGVQWLAEYSAALALHRSLPCALWHQSL